MPPSNAALRRALVRAMAFPHHKAQETTAPDARPAGAGVSNQHRGTLWRRVRTSSPRPRKRFLPISPTPRPSIATTRATWKAPLWQALSEAGLPLAWVGEDCGGSGASLAEGFGVLSAAGRFAVAVPLAETMLAGWLLEQAKISSPEGEMTVVPAAPKDRITLNADGSLSGRARGVPFAKAAKHFAVLASGAGGISIALVDASKCRIEAGAQSRRRPFRHRHARQGRSRSRPRRRQKVSTRRS